MNERRSIWSLSFFPILLTYFIDSFGQAVIFPIFTALLLSPQFNLLGSDLRILHKTAILVAVSVSFPLARIFGSTFLGELSDRIGRKKVFTMTISGGIIGYLLSGWGIQAETLGLLWLGRMISGFFSGNLTLCLAAIADISHLKSDRVRHFGVVGIIGGLGFVCAILVAAVSANAHFIDFFHPEFPLYLAGFLSLLNLFLILLFFKESHLAKPWEKINLVRVLKTIGTALKVERVGNIILVYFFFTLSWSMSLQFLSTYLTDLYHISTAKIPVFFLAATALWCFSNFVMIPLLSRFFSPPKTLFLGLIFLTFFLFLTVFHDHSIYPFLLIFSCASIGAAICWTTGLATLSLISPNSLQGTLLGLNQSSTAIAFVLGPIIGEIISHLNVHELYILTGAFSLIATLLLSFRFRSRYA